MTPIFLDVDFCLPTGEVGLGGDFTPGDLSERVVQFVNGGDSRAGC